MKSFKGAMARFYGEQRAQVKGIKERSLVNKARNEAKRELEEAQSDAPLHALRLDGCSARLVRNNAQFYSQQQAEGLVPWGAHPEVMMDRYDVRALLDIYVEPDPRVWRHRQRSAHEMELEEQVTFEAFRDLIRLKCLGLSEKQGLRHAEQENVAIRAQARTAAVAALEQVKVPKALPSQHAAFAAGGSAIPAGTGQFAAVGFSYGGGAGAEGGEDEGRESGEEGEEDSEDDLPATAEDQDMDRCALRDFKVEDFSSMLRWAMREEAEEAAANRRRNRRGWSRKKARLRAKRLLGQGLDPALYYKGPPPQQGPQAGGGDISWIPERRPEDLAQRYTSRNSPEYEPLARPRLPDGGSRLGCTDHPQAEFITSFGSVDQPPAEHGVVVRRQQQQQQQQQQGVKDALPGVADPALEGPAMLPAAAFKLHGVRAEDAREWDRYGGSVSGREYSRAKAAAATLAAAHTVVRAAGGKETPQERLKRLMAAQLNKKIQKDSLTAAQKQQQEEAERRARMANEIAAQEAELRDGGGGYQQQLRGQGRDADKEPSGSSPSGSGSRSRSRERDRGQERSGERCGGGDGGGHHSRGSGDHFQRRSRSRSRDRDRSRVRDGQYRGSSRRSTSPPRHHNRGRR